MMTARKGFDDMSNYNELISKCRLPVKSKVCQQRKCQRTTEYPELKNCSNLLPPYGATPEDVRAVLERVRNLEHKDEKESIHRVMRYGLLINGKKYFVPDLVFEHFGEKVKVIVENNIATVYDIETDEQIVWFELDKEIDNEYISRTNYFEEAMYYLLKHHALMFENGKLYFLQQNLPEIQLFPRNCKTKMIQRIINFCEKI